MYERDPQGMAETRLRAATLLCKIFLQYIVRLVENESRAVGGLFVKVLDKLERFMRGERDLLVRLRSVSELGFPVDADGEWDRTRLGNH